MMLKKLADADVLPPKRETRGSAAYDLRAAHEIEISPGAQAKIHTGYALGLPDGYCATIWPRSGMALKSRIDRRGGLIDEDYRGEVQVILKNEGDEPFQIKRNQRIAQLRVEPYERLSTVLVEDFPDDTERGEQGFGSTGDN